VIELSKPPRADESRLFKIMTLVLPDSCVTVRSIILPVLR
jgi:hypothetical protein